MFIPILVALQKMNILFILCLSGSSNLCLLGWILSLLKCLRELRVGALNAT